MKLENPPARDPLDEWLERAAAGARDVLADYAAEHLHLRGTCYPDSSEAPAIDQALRDVTAAHFLATRSIPLWLRSCKRCKGSKPEDKEYCESCQKKEEDEAAEWRAEERFRRYTEANFMR